MGTARANSAVDSVAGKTSAEQIGRLTGGTGKFTSINGHLRSTANFDIRTGFNEVQSEIEYTIDN
jgi:hypothetical protein